MKTALAVLGAMYVMNCGAVRAQSPPATNPLEEIVNTPHSFDTPHSPRNYLDYPKECPVPDDWEEQLPKLFKEISQRVRTIALDVYKTGEHEGAYDTWRKTYKAGDHEISVEYIDGGLRPTQPNGHVDNEDRVHVYVKPEGIIFRDGSLNGFQPWGETRDFTDETTRTRCMFKFHINYDDPKDSYWVNREYLEVLDAVVAVINGDKSGR